MRLLLDTHILVSLARSKLSEIAPEARAAISDAGNTLFVSAASLREIAIKTRIGKLNRIRPLDRLAGISKRSDSCISQLITGMPWLPSNRCPRRAILSIGSCSRNAPSKACVCSQPIACSRAIRWRGARRDAA